MALVLGGSAAANAQTQNQDTWSLQECIDYAIKNNLQVRQSQNTAQLNEVDYKQARAAILPTVNGNASGGINFGSSIDPITSEFRTEQIKSSNFSVSSGVTLFAGRQIQNRIAQTKLSSEAGMLDAEKTKNDVILNIVTAYMQVIFAEELLQTAQLQLNTTQTQAERTEKLFTAGSVAEGSLLEIQAQVATDELAIINAQNQKAQAELQLIQLLDLDNAENFEVEKPELPEPDQAVITFDANQVYEAAKQNLPEIKSADTKVKAAVKGVDVAKGAYYPRLTLSGSIFTGYSSARSLFQQGTGLVAQPLGFTDETGSQTITVYRPQTITTNYAFGDQFNDNLGKSLNLSLNIPIFNGFQSRYGVSRARIGLRNAEIASEIAKNQLRQQVQQAYADALAAQKKYTAAKKQLNALERSYRNAEIRFNAGVLNTTDFNVAANNYRRAQSEIIQAKYDFIFKLKILDFYQGKPLSF
ncbi:MAG: TolC family protein [Hymenobacteraceae bacterium]|nr:TolC family protein [Hymenobacteraceae bacterium]MDX5396180.1 TolC family protein [Hymenobacteraceae bacterium]MDX5443206.1 TolC family protein [Hymenobacteraceae bacterium]MDX5512241.1 TolC family protein [Hymenobacteraceae bacterium]